MQLSKHIGKAVWSTSDRVLTVLMGLAFIIPQKVIGDTQWGIYSTVQALLVAMYMLTDSLGLQAMVNFGMDESRRREAFTYSAVVHTVFIALGTTSVYFGRHMLADFFAEPALVATLGYFPLVSLGFLVRTYSIKVSQLYIDPRSNFFIDLAWVGTTILLILYGWRNGTLVDANDMMVISAIASSASSLTGLWLHRKVVRFSRRFDRGYVRQMIGFGLAHCGSAITLALQTQGDTLILKKFASSALVGNYDAAKKFFRGFEALRDAGSALVYPMVAKLATAKREAELVHILEKVIGFMTIAIAPIVLLVWIGPTEEIFSFIYKGKYQDAAIIFKYLSIAALAIPLTMNSFVLGGLGQARRYFRVTLTSALLSVVTALIFIPLLQARGAALSVVVSYFVLGILATQAVRQWVPVSISGSLGRWRDVRDFVVRGIERLKK